MRGGAGRRWGAGGRGLEEAAPEAAVSSASFRRLTLAWLGLSLGFIVVVVVVISVMVEVVVVVVMMVVLVVVVVVVGGRAEGGAHPHRGVAARPLRLERLRGHLVSVVSIW